MVLSTKSMKAKPATPPTERDFYRNARWLMFQKFHLGSSPW